VQAVVDMITARTEVAAGAPAEHAVSGLCRGGLPEVLAAFGAAHTRGDDYVLAADQGDFQRLIFAFCC